MPDAEKVFETCSSPDTLAEAESIDVSPAGTSAEFWTARLDALSSKLEQESGARKRAQCMAHIQNHAMELALDLLVREPDVEGFFRAFTRTLIDLGETSTCGVWLLDGEASHCRLWMAHLGDHFFTKASPDWESIALPRENMTEHLFAYTPGWSETIEYAGDDERLPESVREFNRSIGIRSLVVAPLLLPTRNLGWIAITTGVEQDAADAPWRKALLEAVSRQATLALHHNQIAEQNQLEARRQAVLEERNRIARDIHDTLAQGFAAILMQLQSAQRSTASLPPAVARSIETAVDLARTHMIDARRSVCALRPQDSESGDVAGMLQRMADFARRTTDVPIELRIGELPPFGGGADRDIVAIAQEALSNAVMHSRARRITIDASAIRSLGFRLSIADDGRGIAKERFGMGFGLTTMQERADRIGASLTIVTAPRSGTEVVLAWEPPSFTVPRKDNVAG